MTDLPAEVTTGKVVGLFQLTAPDSGDVGSQPDAAPGVGGLKIEAQRPYYRTLLPAPATIGSFSGVFKLDAEGYLVDAQGSRGVWLPLGTYDVTFTIKRLRINPVSITVTADHTEENPLDLSIAIPPAAAAPLTDGQYAELSVRLSNLLTYVDAYLTDNPPNGGVSDLDNGYLIINPSSIS